MRDIDNPQPTRTPMRAAPHKATRHQAQAGKPHRKTVKGETTMTAFVYYKTRKNILRCYTSCTPKQMWADINKVLSKGYTVKEVQVWDGSGTSYFTLHYDAQGEPLLRKF